MGIFDFLRKELLYKQQINYKVCKGLFYISFMKKIDFFGMHVFSSLQFVNKITNTPDKNDKGLMWKRQISDLK